jgi:hypothetical protein
MDWKKMHDEEFPDLYSSPNIGNMRWAGTVERMGDRRGHTGSRRGTMKGRDPSENLGEERIILKSTLKKYDGRACIALAESEEKWQVL